MNVRYYQEKTVEVIENYLNGTLSNNEASKWALDIIISPDWEKLPEEISNAIHSLCDLDDVGKSWCPTRDELEKCKDAIKKM